MNKALEFIDEIVQGSYRPIEDRFPDRYKNFENRIEYRASQWAQRGTGAAEFFGSLLLATSDIPYAFSVALILAFDGASRLGGGQGIIANSREIGRNLITYLKKVY